MVWGNFCCFFCASMSRGYEYLVVLILHMSMGMFTLCHDDTVHEHGLVAKHVHIMVAQYHTVDNGDYGCGLLGVVSSDQSLSCMTCMTFTPQYPLVVAGVGLVCLVTCPCLSCFSPEHSGLISTRSCWAWCSLSYGDGQHVRVWILLI